MLKLLSSRFFFTHPMSVNRIFSRHNFLKGYGNCSEVKPVGVITKKVRESYIDNAMLSSKKEKTEL